MLTPEKAVVLSILLCLAGAIATLVTSRNRTVAGWVAFLFTGVTAVLLFQAAIHVLVSGAGHPSEFLRLPALGFALRIHVDGLSAWFLMIAAGIAVPAMFYSIAYMRHYADYSVARYYPYFLLFLASMYGLVTTTDMMWFFFIFWQMMTFSGYGLIRFENKIPSNLRAANKFLIMMQIACALTMIGAELLAVSSAAAGGDALKYDFDSVSANVPALLAAKPGIAALAFTMFLIGFGIKLGMWPFGQIWLPDAHPAAPSPVSAMLSGVMIKTGVYGIMRYFLWLVPVEGHALYPMGTWGAIIAGLGTLTLLTGTLQALQQEQTKRLLAFHSIGQVGYILLGIGACLAIMPSKNPALLAVAALGFLGAMFHTLNHALFKSLLFLNSGSILWATGTQNLNQLGGLMRYMPLTAITAIIASFSISGVPLFNGFASKWSLYVATIQGHEAARYLLVCGVLAILTSALTLASFIKFFGVSFSSRTSDLVAGAAKRNGRLEVNGMMQLPQLILAGLCLLLGLVPALAFGWMHQALLASQHGLGTVLAQTTPIESGMFLGLAGLTGSALFAPLALALILALMFLAAYGISRLGGSKRRADEAWLCGYAREKDSNRYSAHSFYGEIKRYFKWLGGASPNAREPVSKPESNTSESR